MYRSITSISESGHQDLKNNIIVTILKNYEECLSDGYKFYCGEDKVDKVLKELAMAIIDELDQIK